jgi:crotonobetainyl-CoA:carnitine CoA-transferase CaiB-like acyl-CoA transferase
MILAGVFADPQTRDQEVIVAAGHPGDAVLQELGYSGDEIAELRGKGVV